MVEKSVEVVIFALHKADLLLSVLDWGMMEVIVDCVKIEIQLKAVELGLSCWGDRLAAFSRAHFLPYMKNFTAIFNLSRGDSRRAQMYTNCVTLHKMTTAIQNQTNSNVKFFLMCRRSSSPLFLKNIQKLHKVSFNK